MATPTLRACLMQQRFCRADVGPLACELRRQAQGQLRGQLQLGEPELGQPGGARRLADINGEAMAHLLELALQVGQRGAGLREVEALRDGVGLRAPCRAFSSRSVMASWRSCSATISSVAAICSRSDASRIAAVTTLPASIRRAASSS